MAPGLARGCHCVVQFVALAVPGVLAAYYVVTLAYNFKLKRVVMIDVLVLAGLYTVRIVAGAAAAAIPLSFWLLMFSIFIFLSLAIVKRYAELYVMREKGVSRHRGVVIRWPTSASCKTWARHRATSAFWCWPCM